MMENKEKAMDNKREIEYSGGIHISWGLNILNTEVRILADGTHLMKLFTYVTSKEAQALRNNQYSVLFGKDFYDSYGEAKKRAELSVTNTKDLVYICVEVNMTGTVFDKLSTPDVNDLELFFNSNKNRLLEEFKQVQGLSLDTFVIFKCKVEHMHKIGIIRGIQAVKSDKHDLKCVAQRSVVVYTLIDIDILFHSKEGIAFYS